MTGESDEVGNRDLSGRFEGEESKGGINAANTEKSPT